MLRRLWILIAMLVLAAPVLAQDDPMLSGSHPFSAEDLVRLDRISSMTVSPNGEQIAFVLRSTDMEADRGRTDLFVMSSNGSNMRRLTTHEASDFNPVWNNDSNGLYFLSTRSGSSQVHFLSLGGGEAHQVTELPLDVGDLKLSPNGKQLAFSMEVFLDCESLECTTDRLEEVADQKTTGVIYDATIVRHWDTWKDGRRRHLFVADLMADGTIGDPADMMPGMNADCPSKPFGGSEEFDFAPGGGMVFTAKNVGAAESWSTNFDLWFAAAPGETPINLTVQNDAWDTAPVFSPDGKKLAWLAMQVPGYEADRFRIRVRDWNFDTNSDDLGSAVASWSAGPPREVAASWDRSAYSLSWSDDGSAFLVHANNLGRRALFRITEATGEVKTLVDEGSVGGEQEVNGTVYFTRDSMDSPVDIYSISNRGKRETRLTEINAERMSLARTGESEQFQFRGANGDMVSAWMVKPAEFDESQKYPVAFLIHGGPQGSFGSSFHYRWNPQTYAGAGYAAVMVDFHGSTGYGQEFCDSIRDNWGGWPLEDLQKGLAAALEKYPWMDGDRVAALGASYGGYMVNWIAGNWPDRFTCLVNHDGLFDTEFMYYSTEELWFPEREFLGPPHERRGSYDAWNPALHVDKWVTPMLVVHGELDHRVPITQGLATFNALQRKGVPSRLLYYPDENHWVLKPHNSLQWHSEVLSWMNQWTNPEAGE